MIKRILVTVFLSCLALTWISVSLWLISDLNWNWKLYSGLLLLTTGFGIVIGWAIEETIRSEKRIKKDYFQGGKLK